MQHRLDSLISGDWVIRERAGRTVAHVVADRLPYAVFALIPKLVGVLSTLRYVPDLVSQHPGGVTDFPQEAIWLLRKSLFFRRRWSPDRARREYTCFEKWQKSHRDTVHPIEARGRRTCRHIYTL